MNNPIAWLFGIWFLCGPLIDGFNAVLLILITAGVVVATEHIARKVPNE